MEKHSIYICCVGLLFGITFTADYHDCLDLDNVFVWCTRTLGLISSVSIGSMRLPNLISQEPNFLFLTELTGRVKKYET